MLKNKSSFEPNLFVVFIQPNNIYCGLKLTEITLPEQCAVLGILRNNSIISINDCPIINAGDYILAMAINPMLSPALKVTLKKSHPVYYSLKNCLIKIEEQQDTNAKARRTPTPILLG